MASSPPLALFARLSSPPCLLLSVLLPLTPLRGVECFGVLDGAALSALRVRDAFSLPRSFSLSFSLPLSLVRTLSTLPPRGFAAPASAATRSLELARGDVGCCRVARGDVLLRLGSRPSPPAVALDCPVSAPRPR